MLQFFFAVATIFLMICLGYLVRRRGMINDAFNRQLSLLLVNLFYPALILSSLTRNFTWSTLIANWPLPLGSAMIMLLGGLVALLVQPLLRRQPRATRGMFTFQSMINNYSFLPIMLAQVLLDERAIAYVIFSSLGAELTVWIIGVRALSPGATSWRSTLRSLLSVPMMAMIAGMLFLLIRQLLGGVSGNLMNSSLFKNSMMMCDHALFMMGQATIPASAVIAGSRMATLHWGHIVTRLTLGATLLRLVMVPALATVLIVFLPFPAEIRAVLLIVAAQPCSMVSVTLAEVYGSDASFAAATVLLTHVAALITIPLWLAAPWFG